MTDFSGLFKVSYDEIAEDVTFKKHDTSDYAPKFHLLIFC